MKDIIKGLQYAIDKDLTRAEKEVVMLLLTGSSTIKEVADLRETNYLAARNLLSNLSYKGAVISKKAEDKKTLVFTVIN